MQVEADFGDPHRGTRSGTGKVKLEENLASVAAAEPRKTKVASVISIGPAKAEALASEKMATVAAEYGRSQETGRPVRTRLNNFVSQNPPNRPPRILCIPNVI